MIYRADLPLKKSEMRCGVARGSLHQLCRFLDRVQNSHTEAEEESIKVEGR